MKRISAQTRLVAVFMPNVNATGEKAWSTYWVSIDEVEKQTGYDLLSNVPVEVQRVIESVVDKTSI